MAIRAHGRDNLVALNCFLDIWCDPSRGSEVKYAYFSSSKLGILIFAQMRENHRETHRWSRTLSLPCLRSPGLGRPLLAHPPERFLVWLSHNRDYRTPVRKSGSFVTHS